MLPFEYVCHPPPPPLRIDPPSLFLDQEEEEEEEEWVGWVEEERPALPEERSGKNFPRRRKSTRPQCHRLGVHPRVDGVRRFFTSFRDERVESPFPFARKGEKKGRGEEYRGNFSNAVISRKRRYRFFPATLFFREKSCIYPRRQSGFFDFNFRGGEGRGIESC